MNWQEEQAAKTKALSDLTAAIARELGGSWKTIPPNEPTDATDRIANGNGAVLHVSIVWNHKDRVCISGSLNIGRHGQYVSVYENGQRLSVDGITVAVARGTAAIAKEIQRRLMPEYLRILELAKAQLKRENEITAKRQANIRKLVAITGEKLPDFEQTPDVSRLWTKRGTLDVHYDDTVSFERMTVSMEQAEYILRYLSKK